MNMAQRIGVRLRSLWWDWTRSRKRLRAKRQKYAVLKAWAFEQHRLAEARLLKIEALEDFIRAQREQLESMIAKLERVKAQRRAETVSAVASYRKRIERPTA